VLNCANSASPNAAFSTDTDIIIFEVGVTKNKRIVKQKKSITMEIKQLCYIHFV